MAGTWENVLTPSSVHGRPVRNTHILNKRLDKPFTSTSPDTSYIQRHLACLLNRHTYLHFFPFLALRARRIYSLAVAGLAVASLLVWPFRGLSYPNPHIPHPLSGTRHTRAQAEGTRERYVRPREPSAPVLRGVLPRGAIRMPTSGVVRWLDPVSFFFFYSGP